MALNTLLENEAQAEIEQIRSDARKQADRILAEAQERAQLLLDGQKRALETQRQAQLVQARSAAELTLSASRLKASEDSLSQVYARVEEQLGSIPKTPQYREILQQLISEVRSVLPDIQVLEVNPADAQLARELAADFSIRENPAIVGGVRAFAHEGKSSVTNTLAERLQRVKNELAPQISRLLAE